MGNVQKTIYSSRALLKLIYKNEIPRSLYKYERLSLEYNTLDRDSSDKYHICKSFNTTY